MPKRKTSKRKVLVTTVHRGVFHGVLVSERGDVVTLADCRNIVYWSQATHGFLGLAKNGPAAGSRVGPAAPLTVLRALTSVTDCTAKASAAIEAEPWS